MVNGQPWSLESLERPDFIPKTKGALPKPLDPGGFGAFGPVEGSDREMVAGWWVWLRFPGLSCCSLVHLSNYPTLAKLTYKKVGFMFGYKAR